MTSLIDDVPEGMNTPEFSVSEISGAVKRMVEGEFRHIRVRGELGRVSRPRSGHVYLDLKDERAVLAGVIWKGVASGLAVQPEEGMEIVATGRLTTFPGQSKYQIVIEDLAPAGVGALMAMLEKRRKALAAEGLFDAERKRRLPYLPTRIGVVTSPSGAVIRDILHRLADRFPVHVLVWPVAVQGEKCAPEVTAAIAGFGAMPEKTRPDVLIVARGGGSVEDLWGFNEEAVVRAAATSPIPLISAVGHETDTTLIDHAADQRAPTPSAAAEMAVPVRAELAALVADLQTRRLRAMTGRLERARQRLSDIARALPRPQQILMERRQRLDLLSAGLPDPARLIALAYQNLEHTAVRLPVGLRGQIAAARLMLMNTAAGLSPKHLQQGIGARRQTLLRRADRLAPALGQQTQRHRLGLARLGTRLSPRLLGGQSDRIRQKLEGLSRMLATLSYKNTLARGYAVLRDGADDVISSASAVAPGMALSIELSDGRVAVSADGKGDAMETPLRKPKSQPRKKQDPGQGSLF